MAFTMLGRTHTVSQLITNPAAVTNLIVHAAATKPLVAIHARVLPAQAALVTEAGCVTRLVRKTVAGTYTSIAATLFMNHDGLGDATFTAGHTASGEGTETDFISMPWNSRVGMDWFPTPEEYILVPAGVANGFGLRSNVAPPAGIYEFQLTVVEFG